MNSTTASERNRSDHHLVILGASARSLAGSARRAGWEVFAADLFRDLDLVSSVRSAVAVPFMPQGGAPGYPWNLLEAASAFPADAAWCYTGAIENHPELIDAVSRIRPLAGNSGDCVRHLRDHRALAAAARAARLAFPETRDSPDDVPLDGTWLVKPQASAGGRGIRRWNSTSKDDQRPGDPPSPPPTRVWQRVVVGSPLSASYIFARGRARLLGASRQLIGESWSHASPFAWCGAIVSPPSAEARNIERLTAALDRLGDVLAARFQPVGLVGVDLVADAHDRITVIEVNPRPTASMELFERMGSASIAGCHMAACGYETPAPAPDDRPGSTAGNAWAKAVLFAPSPTRVTRGVIDHLAREADPWTRTDDGWPALADIPRPAQTIASGSPVVTIFATAATTEGALTVLRDRVARIDAVLASMRRP